MGVESADCPSNEPRTQWSCRRRDCGLSPQAAGRFLSERSTPRAVQGGPWLAVCIIYIYVSKNNNGNNQMKMIDDDDDDGMG